MAAARMRRLKLEPETRRIVGGVSVVAIRATLRGNTITRSARCGRWMRRGCAGLAREREIRRAVRFTKRHGDSQNRGQKARARLPRSPGWLAKSHGERAFWHGRNT